MNIISYIYALPLLALSFAACSDDDTPDHIRYSQMVVCRNISLADNATVNPNNPPTVVISYNNLVAVTEGAQIKVNDLPVTAHASGMEMELTLPKLEKYTDYTLTIAPGAVALANNPQTTNTEPITITFNTNFGVNTAMLHKAPVNPKATDAAKNLYATLLADYGQKMRSGAMGGVGWELDYTDVIASEIGVYPTVVGFDYLHLPSSPSNWIDYGDITPVKTVHDAGCIVQIQWHWNVPESEDNTGTGTADKTMIWEGSVAMPADWSGSVQLTDAKSIEAFASASVGDVIEVEVKNVAAGAQGSFKNSSWKEIAPGTEYFDITGNFSLTIDAGVLSSLQSSGIIISGRDYTATKVTLSKPESKAQKALSRGFSADNNGFKPSNVMIDGTWENKVATADIEKLAGYLKLLADANIPVLWRPLHEAAGDYTWGAWFWWGSEGVEVTKQLYRYLYDQLTNKYGLNNLIWVWTVQTSSAGAPAEKEIMQAAYPGDEYVDIVGTDIYAPSPLTDQSEQFYMVNSVVDSHKMVALTECGNLIDPESAIDNGALWSYFMQWYDLNETYGHHNYDGAQWTSVLNNPAVINVNK